MSDTDRGDLVTTVTDPTLKWYKLGSLGSEEESDL